MTAIWGRAIPLSVTGLEEFIGGKLWMPSYQSLCFLSSSSQPRSSSLATTLARARSISDSRIQRRSHTHRISWSAPLLFPLADCYAVSSPKKGIDRRTAMFEMVMSLIGQNGEQRQTETHLRTSFQTFPILLEERSYVLASVSIVPTESRLEEFVEFIGEVVR